jgi:aminoglycoside phosphotransferase (APT) family kinase protein
VDGDEQEARSGALADWLSDCLGQAVDPRALVLDRPSGGGWSNDTWLVDTGLADPARVVVRLLPDRESMFPTYDLGRQVACLRLLAGERDVPVPTVHAADPAGHRLGRPAFVMEFVAGRVPRDDSPTFAEAGWLHDATEAQQRRFHTALLDAIAAVHSTRLPDESPTPLRLRPGTDSNRAAVETLRDLWGWDRGDRWPAEVDPALDRLTAAVPEPTTDVLLWGDARPANVVVAADGFEPVALLDWELATIGSPEQDLTWLLEMNHLRIRGAGLDPLPGFLTDDEAVERYRSGSGRRLQHLTWYRYLAAVRVAVLMHRYLRAMVHAGRLPADHKLFAGTVATRRLAELRP